MVVHCSIAHSAQADNQMRSDMGASDRLRWHAGAGADMVRTTAAGKLAIDNVNKKWRSPNEPKASDEKVSAGNDLSKEEAGELWKASAEPDLTQEEEEAWLETVNASAASAAAAGRSAAKQ